MPPTHTRQATMTIAERPTSPAFRRMPEELLTMIVEPLLKSHDHRRYSHDFETLKNLRLASSQFATLPRLLAALFHGVRLVASPEGIEDAKTVDLTWAKRYVKRVVFEPSKYSWTMTREAWEEVIMVKPMIEMEELKRVRDQHNNEVNQKREQQGGAMTGLTYLDDNFGGIGWREVVKQHLGGKAPFSEEELRNGWEKYHAAAQATQNLFEGGVVESVWTNVLGQLDASSFRVGYWRFDDDWSTKGRSWKEVGCDVWGHKHCWGRDGHMHHHEKCRHVQVPVSEALFRAVLKALGATGVKPVTLDIGCAVDGHFTWADDEALDILDLSGLQSLVFQPLEGAWEGGEERERVEERYAHAILALLDKCKESIKELELHNGVPLVWPPRSADTIITLPKLERFWTNVDLSLSDFATFLKQAEHLGRLQLDSTHRARGSGEWRDLWRAIRYHKSRMHLELYQIPCHDATEIGIQHWTGEESKQENDPDDLWGSIGHNLENYLSNLGSWNRCCRYWFDQVGTDDDSDDWSHSGEEDDEGGNWDEEDDDDVDDDEDEGEGSEQDDDEEDN